MRNKRNKYIALIVSLIMLFDFVPLSAFAEEPVVVDVSESQTVPVVLEPEEEFWEEVISKHIDDYTVTVTVTKEAEFPVGTTVTINPLDSNDYRNEAATLFDRKDNELGSFIRVFDITFWYDGMEIEPLVPVDVKVTFDNAVELEGNNELKLIHLHEDEAAKEIEAETETAETEEAAAIESLSFQSDKFSTYIVAEEVVVYTFSESGNNYEVVLKCNSAMGIPQDAVFTVEEITEDSDLYDQYAAQVAAVINPEGGVRMPALLDISLKTAEGEKIQLDNKVQVIVRLTDENVQKGLQVVHFPGEDPFQGESAVRDAVANNDINKEEIEILDIEHERLYARLNTKENTVTFNTDSFSVFALAYTVDFEYTDPETGETFAWSWPGKGSYSVASIMSVLGVAGEIGDVMLECVEGEEIEGALYLEQKVGEWYLTSDVAFDETYELTVVVDGKAYIVIVTDDQQTPELNRISITFKQDGGEAADTGAALDGTYYVVLKNTIYWPNTYSYGWWSQVSLTDGVYSVSIDNATIESFLNDKQVDTTSYSDASNLNCVSADSIKLVKYSGSDAESDIKNYVLNNQTNNITEINNNSKIGSYTVSRAESIDSEGNYAITAVKDPVFTVQGIAFPTGETVSLADSYYLAIGYTENYNTVYKYYAQISADGTIGAIKDASGTTVTEIPQATSFCLVKPVNSFSITSLNDINGNINDASKIEKIEDAGEFDKYLINLPSNMTPDSRVYSITATKQRDYNVSLTFRDIDYNKLNDVTLDGDYYMLAKEGVTYKYYAPVTTSGTGIGTIRDAIDQEVTDGMYGIDGIEFVKYTGTATMSNLTGQNPKLSNGSLIDDLYLLEIPDYAVNYAYTLNAIRQPNRTASMQFIDAAGANIADDVTLNGKYYIVAYDGGTAKYYAPVTGASGALTFYEGENTPVAEMPYMSSFALRKTESAATKLDEARGGQDQNMMLTGSDGTTEYVLTYQVNADSFEFEAAETRQYEVSVVFKDTSGNVIVPQDITADDYKAFGSLIRNGVTYGSISGAFAYISENNTYTASLDEFKKDRLGNGGTIQCTAFDDVAVTFVKGTADIDQNGPALDDPNKAFAIGDAIGSYAMTSVTDDKINGKTTIVFQMADPYHYSISTNDGASIAFDSTSDSNWYILSVLKKANGRSFHYVKPIMLQGQTTVTDTISTYYSNTDPSKISISSPDADTDTRFSVYSEGDTVSTVLIHMNNPASTYKDVLQLEENGNVKGEMYGDGDGANCYTLDVTNEGGTSALILTKAVIPTITVNFQDAAGAEKASILESDNYYLYVELDRGRGEDSYGYVTGKLDLTQATQTFTIPYFHAANKDTKHGTTIDGTTRHAYLTDGRSYTAYVVQRNDSAPTVDWCKYETGVILYDNGARIEKTILDTTSARNITAPYTTYADELNGTVIIREMPVLSIRTEFKANNADETAPITLTGHRYDLLVSMTDAGGNTYYRLMPVNTAANPSAAASIPSFITKDDDGKLYYYTGAETISVALVQTTGDTAPGLHNAIYGEGGCLVYKEGMVTSDGYAVSSATSGNVITTTLEKKAATATEFTANITFYDKKNGSQLTSLDPQLSGNYYLLSALNTGDSENGYTPVAYTITPITSDQMNTANTTGAFTVTLPDSTTYKLIDANGNEVAGSTLSFDPALFTMSTRLYNTTGDIPTTYAGARAGNDTISGYDFWENILNAGGTTANIKLYNAYKKIYLIQLDFSEPITISDSDALHIMVEAQHATTGTDVFEMDVTGAELSSWTHVIEDQTKTPIEQHWNIPLATDGNTFSGNEKVTITLSRNGSNIAQGGMAYDYTVNYAPDTIRTEVTDDTNRITTITDYVELTRISASYDYNFYSILGDGVGYGITADYLYQNGHIQSNFATNYYYGNNIIEPDLAGHGAVIVIADYALKEGKALEIGGSHVAGTDTVIYLGNGGTLDLVRNVEQRQWVHVVPSSTEELTNNVVNPIIYHMQTISAELSTHDITIHPSPNNENRMYIDLLDFPSDATIYLDGDELNHWIAKGNDGLFIKKHKDQTIVFNYDSADTATLGQYHVMYADATEDTRFNPATGNYFSTHSPTGKGDIDNVFADELAKHVVYNLRSVKHITADTIVGMVLVPRADSTMEITGTSAGWVISAGYVTNSGAEWHSVYADMPDSSTTDLTIFKTMDEEGRTPGKYQVFNFSLDHLITTGSSHTWHTMGNESNSSRTVKFTSINEMETGWNVYKITETGPALGTVGSYVYDSRSVYAFVKYFAVGGRVMVAGTPRYYMEMDASDEPAVKEFTFDKDTFDPSRDTLRQAVGENTAGVNLKAMNIPTFNNTTRRDGLEVRKIVTGTNNQNARFNFEIEIWLETTDEEKIFEDAETTKDYPLFGVSGQEMITFTKQTSQHAQYATANLTLKANQMANITGIPVGAHYVVTELSTVADITDENKDDPVNLDPTTHSSNGYTLTGKIGDTGVIVENAAKTATFTNVYHAVGEYPLNVTKTMLGHEMTENMFLFVIEKDGEVKLTGASQAAQAGVPAAIAWTPENKLTFDQNDIGEHTYLIKERTDQLPDNVSSVGVTEYELKLSVTDNHNGTLTVTRIGENANQDDFTFVNTLKTTQTLTGIKTLLGRNMEDGETFTFNVTEKIGGKDVVVATGVATGPSNENQPVNIVFTPIVYEYDGDARNYPQTHTYTITEDETNLNRGVTNTTGSDFTARVKVSYNEEEKTFTASEPEYEKDVAFINTWVETGISFSVTKEWKREGVAVFTPRTITFSVKKDGVDFDLTDVTVEKTGEGSCTVSGNTVTLAAGTTGWPTVIFKNVPEATYVVTETNYDGEEDENTFATIYALNGTDKASNAEAAATQNGDEILIKNSETIPGDNRAELTLKKIWDTTAFPNEADKQTVTYELYQVAASGSSGGEGTSGSVSVTVNVFYGNKLQATATFVGSPNENVKVNFTGFVNVQNNTIYCYGVNPQIAVSLSNGVGSHSFKVPDSDTTYDFQINYIENQEAYNAENQDISVELPISIIVEKLKASLSTHSEMVSLGGTKYGEYELDQDHWSGITVAVPKSTGSTRWQYYVVEKNGDSYMAEYTQGANNTLIVTNKKRPLGSVRVTKTFSGIAVGQIPGSFRITATWGTGANAQTRQLAISANGCVDGESYSDVSFENNGLTCTWTINNLPLDTEVTFVESGYGINGYNVVATYSPGNGKANAAVTPEAVTITNEYTAGVELPATGGPGTALYTFLGLMILLLAGGLLVFNRWRGARENK